VTELTIEVEAFWGDFDTHRELHLVGPFPTVQAREQALNLLQALPGNRGDAKFFFSSKPMNAADELIDLSPETGQPDRLSRIGCFHELVDAFEFGPGGG
jgi:hypothetical protein